MKLGWKTIALAAALSFCCGALPAMAKKDSEPARQTMQKMQVTSTRTQKEADLAPASVSVITSEDMEMMQVNTIDEALRFEEGLFLDRPGGLGDALPSTTMRGLPGDERSLVMVDGFPVNDPYSSLVPYNMIDPDSISQIEVVRGPGSALYGGDAMGGSINLITADPKKLEMGVRTGIGSFNTQSAGGYVGDKINDRLSLRACFDWTAMEGYPTALVTKTFKEQANNEIFGGYPINYDVDPETNQIVKRWAVGDKGKKNAERFGGSLRASLKTSDTGKLTFLFIGGDHSYSYEAPNSYLRDADGNVVWTGKVDMGNGLATSKVNPKDFLAGKGSRQYYMPALTFSESFGSVDFTAKLCWQRRDGMYTSVSQATSAQGYYNAAGSVVESTSDDYMAEVQADWSFELGRTHVLTGGLFFKESSFEQESTKLSYFNDEDSKFGGVFDVTDGDTRFLAPFVQVEWSLLDSLTLYTGARADWWWASDGKSGDPAAPVLFEDKDKNTVSPKISTVWEAVKDATYVRGSVAKAFHPPTIYDMFRTWESYGVLYEGNPDLDPETMWNYEAGVDQYLLNRRVKLGATLFYSQVSDLIGTFNVSDDVRKKKNVTDVDIKGIEASMRLYPFDWLQIFANWGHYDSEIQEDKAEPELKGKSLANFPEDIINLGADFRIWKIKYSLYANYNGKTQWREDNAYIEDNVYMGYEPTWTCDTKLSFSPMENVEASVAVNNLFDSGKYWDGAVLAGRSVYGEIRIGM